MKQSEKFLPGFDSDHIESYFSHDFKTIAKIFSLTNDNIQDDLDDIQNAFNSKNIELLNDGIHKLKPIFNLIGLLAVEEEVGRFYSLCKKISSMEDIRNEYFELWPKLINARTMIKNQTMKFLS